MKLSRDFNKNDSDNGQVINVIGELSPGGSNDGTGTGY